MSKVEELAGINVLAHDLKEPLITMRQVALGLDPNSPAMVEQAKAALVSVSESALKQVSDLTKIARLENSLLPPPLEPVFVPTICDEVATELSELYRDEHKSLRINYSRRLPLALANRELLRSIVYNFTTNALHYSASNTNPTLRVRRSSSKIRVEVRDQGPALPTKIWRDLKQGLLKAPVPISMRPNSSGLGLYIAAKFAHHMNAEIGAVRHQDGTTFYLVLPVSRQLSLF